jgi:hypothetical protein
LEPGVLGVLDGRVNVDDLVLQFEFVDGRSFHEITFLDVIIVLELVDPSANLLREPLAEYRLDMRIKDLN